MAGFGVDVDAGSALAARLNGVADSLEQIVANMKKQASDCEALTKTMTLNEQYIRYLNEASDELSKVVPGLRDVYVQLSGIVSSAEQFNESNAQNALGSV